MRLVIAIEIAEGENYSAEVPISEADLQKSAATMADTYARPMLKQILKGFESDDAANLKRSVYFFREKQKRVTQ